MMQRQTVAHAIERTYDDYIEAMADGDNENLESRLIDGELCICEKKTGKIICKKIPDAEEEHKRILADIDKLLPKLVVEAGDLF